MYITYFTPITLCITCITFVDLVVDLYLVVFLLKHQVYVASSDPHVCCGSCKNVSCSFTSENGTTEVFTVYQTLSFIKFYTHTVIQYLQNTHD